MSSAAEVEHPEFWFRKMLLEKIDTLTRGQEALSTTQKEMHAANSLRMDKMSEDISKVKTDIQSFQPIKSVVTYGISMILIAVAAAIIGMVVLTPKKIDIPNPVQMVLPDQQSTPAKR